MALSTGNTLEEMFPPQQVTAVFSQVQKNRLYCTTNLTCAAERGTAPTLLILPCWHSVRRQVERDLGDQRRGHFSSSGGVPRDHHRTIHLCIFVNLSHYLSSKMLTHVLKFQPSLFSYSFCCRTTG